MVQACRVDTFGNLPVLLSDPGLRGPPGFGAGPVLEARRMVSPVGSTGFVSGHFIHGTVPRPPPAAPNPTAGTLLRPVLRQIRHRTSGRHGARAWTGSPGHTEKEEGLGTIFSPC